MSWPFDSWLQIAVRRFGMAPSEFWATPVREWLTLLDGTRRPGFDHDAMTRLLDEFPDTGEINEPDR